MPVLADQTPRVTMKDGTRRNVITRPLNKPRPAPAKVASTRPKYAEIETGSAVENAHGECERTRRHDAFDRQVDRTLQDDECRPDRQNERNGGTVRDRPQVLNCRKPGRGEAEAKA